MHRPDALPLPQTLTFLLSPAASLDVSSAAVPELATCRMQQHQQAVPEAWQTRRYCCA